MANTATAAARYNYILTGESLGMNSPPPVDADAAFAALPELYRSALPFRTLRPAQAKAVAAGLLEGENILVSTPTASGKTVIAGLALLRAVTLGQKGIYVAPLKALAAEKVRELPRYGVEAVLSVGDYDEEDSQLALATVIVTTPEKLDSLLRHNVPWIHNISCVIVDEVHLLGDNSRGPTLEILITLLRHILPKVQLVGLSATVQNAPEIAAWLNAKLVTDSWRPVELREATHTPDGLRYKPKKI